MNKTSLIALAAGVLLGSTAVSAQTAEPRRMFLSVNAGAQMQEHSLDSTFTFPIYGQTAAVNTAQNIETGPLFDLSVGATFWNDIGLAFGYTSFKESSDLIGIASIPHPLLLNNPATVEFETGAEHREQNIYIVALWFMPITDRLDVAFSAGPSFIRVEQGTLARLDVPEGTQDAIPVIESQSDWATGINIGFDATYLLTRRYALFGDYGVRIGLGGFIRYNGASATLPSGAEVDAGGFQGGAGLRFRF